MKKILLTGFGPFGDDNINPALEVIKELDKQIIKLSDKSNTNIEYIIETIELPVVFGKAINVFEEAVQQVQPELIISIGQAGGRAGISLEKVGININDARIADNDGNKPEGELIYPHGPAAYFTTIDMEFTLKKLKEAMIPVEISYSASTYVCNNLIYGAMHFLTHSQEYSHVKYGFIHIPYIPLQVISKNKIFPTLPLETIKKAIMVIVETNLLDK
ncbi:MAG: pyroglutamyl-peptidase I [Candidatus Thorarchaeota archaeon]